MSQKRKGIILAGGTGSRLYPITKAISKQLVPVYNKPMIYYPLTTLMQANIREFLIIVNPFDLDNFKNLLGDGSDFGISIEYASQSSPDGIAQAFLIGESFLKGAPSALILGDNLFHGNNFSAQLENASKFEEGATLFACKVSDPRRYGVVKFNNQNEVLEIAEKPEKPLSDYAITGIYFYDQSVVDKAKKIKPSLRGELEITDVNNLYISEKNMKVEFMTSGLAWFDTGNSDSLHEASSYIRSLESRQGLMIGSPEEISWRKGWISNNQLDKLAAKVKKTNYGKYLYGILERNLRSTK